MGYGKISSKQQEILNYIKEEILKIEDIRRLSEKFVKQ